MKRRKKSFGRPQGAPNKEREDVLVMPACCPTCQSTCLRLTRKLDGGPGEVASPGMRNGQMYTHTEYHHGVCDECGQYLRLRTFAFDGRRLSINKETD